MAALDEPTQLLIQSNKADVMVVRICDDDKPGSVFAFMRLPSKTCHSAVRRYRLKRRG